MRNVGIRQLTCVVILVGCGNGGGTVDGGSTDTGTGTDAGSDVVVVEDASNDAITTDGCTTTVEVTVRDPTGKFPMPNVAVFIESGTLPTITTGIGGACPALPTTGVAHTSANGTAGVSTTASGSVNVVAQIGKWRTVTPVTVAACGSAPATIKLPGSKSSTSDVPAIAISTGGADTMECAFHRMGIDGAITVYQGTGGAKGSTSTGSAATLWDSAGHIDAFDAVLLSCEGAETTGAVQQTLYDYTTAGGMVLAEHFQYSWFNTGPFATSSNITWVTGSNRYGNTTANGVIQSNMVGTSLTQWITPLGILVSNEFPTANMEPARNVSAIGTGPTLVMTTDQTTNPANAPLEVTWKEGTSGGGVVFTDFHAGSPSGDYGTTVGSTTVPANASFPSGCATETALTSAEVLFLYTLFEQLSCE